MSDLFDCAVIGAGYYGSEVALELAHKGLKVVLIDSQAEIMNGASRINQARIHGGYHYPRSYRTAVRCQANLEKFRSYWPQAVRIVKSYYAIARGSHVSTQHFEQFCDHVGAPLSIAEAEIAQLFDADSILNCYRVHEGVFDFKVIQDALKIRLSSAVSTKLNHEVKRLKKKGTLWEIHFTPPELKNILAEKIFLCAYSEINSILTESELQTIDLRHELTEICLVSMPERLENLALTVIDGPFFSTLPFPSKNLNSLTHVRFTPHLSWTSEESGARLTLPPPPTNFQFIQKECLKFIPAFDQVTYRESLWTKKTLLNRTEFNDARPILFRTHHGEKNLHVIMGSKIDNIFDAIAELNQVVSL